MNNSHIDKFSTANPLVIILTKCATTNTMFI